jgi:uncharacterized membrane protein YphA (DoxX/SURF4 family)
VELPLFAIRLFLGATFLLASVPKVVAAHEFRRALGNYGLLPIRLVGPVAIWLPRAELIVGLGLLAGVWTPLFAMCASVALLVFAGAVSVNLARGRVIDCGCYGAVSRGEIGWGLVVRDLALAASAGILVFAPAHIWTAGSDSGARTSEALAVVVIVASALCAERLGGEFVRLRRLTRHVG